MTRGLVTVDCNLVYTVLRRETMESRRCQAIATQLLMSHRRKEYSQTKCQHRRIVDVKNNN